MDRMLSDRIDVTNLAQADVTAGAAPPAPPPAWPAPSTLRAQQQLDCICDQLQFHKRQDLAWLPECMDAYMRTALQQAVVPGSTAALEAAAEDAAASRRGQQPPSAMQPPRSEGNGVVVALGSNEHDKGSGAKSARWMAHVGLVACAQHESATGSSTAGTHASAPAAAGAGASASGEPCCLLCIEDAAPAPMGRDLLATLTKGMREALTMCTPGMHACTYVRAHARLLLSCCGHPPMHAAPRRALVTLRPQAGAPAARGRRRSWRR